ncbi:MAG TPA: hypothetical protein DGT21_18345 [Armatimonadetes bacterium]|nr:hypothetical protein [Armatimonadota bacterium]
MLKRIVAGVVILAIIGGGVWFYRSRKAAKAAASEVEIETATVERKDLSITVSASGELEALTTVEVKSRSGGEVTGMFVEAGDYVEAGQIIAEVDATQIRTKVDQATADVNSARAGTAQARLNARSQEVQTYTSVDQARASLEQSRAQVRQAEEELRQSRQTTADAVHKAKASLASAEARLKQAILQRDAGKKLYDADITSAEASLDSRRQSLQLAIAGPRTENIEQARASLRSSQANLANAEKTLERQKALLDKGFISQQAFDDAQKSQKQARADVDRATAALAELEAGNRPEEIAQARASVTQAEASLALAKAGYSDVQVKEQAVTVAEASVEEARANLTSAEADRGSVLVMEQRLKSAKAGLVEAEAALAKAESGTLQDEVKRRQIDIAMADLHKRTLALQDAAYDLQYTQVVAPRSGVIMSKLVEEGTVVPAGTAALREGTGLVTIADISEMYVLADVDEVDIAPVAVDQPCEISVSALESKKLTGKVVKIFPLGQEENQVIRFKVRMKIDNPPKELRPGMTADATIKVAERKNVLVIPDVCVTRDNKAGPFVEVFENGTTTKPEMRAVKVGLSNWEDTEITEGLKEGEVVLIPPPPGSNVPWMQSDKDKAKKEAEDRNRQRMLRQFRNR